MFRDFSVKPKPQNNKARALFIILMVSAFLFVIVSTIVPLYKGIISLLGMTLLVLAMLIYTKYIAPIYFYDLMVDSDGLPLLVIRQQTGKRHTTLCRIALRDVVKVERESRKERKDHKTPKGVVKYAYLPTLDPEESYRISTAGRYEEAEILIESSEEFAQLLSSYAAKAREAYFVD